MDFKSFSTVHKTLTTAGCFNHLEYKKADIGGFTSVSNRRSESNIKLYIYAKQNFPPILFKYREERPSVGVTGAAASRIPPAPGVRASPDTCKRHLPLLPSSPCTPAAWKRKINGK